ncbi:hypothetical protein BpHYR1_004966 [Brachionus plicatilis]|uniref:Uncharacterized protein n=1 Tax=Brachionus plicatilis TaxID=10195 RepID=A0A3M7RNR8_BRAPC|nr:hypothetical protein BpHYR1_004966 [Brachionus plicatilis]
MVNQNQKKFFPNKTTFSLCGYYMSVSAYKHPLLEKPNGAILFDLEKPFDKTSQNDIIESVKMGKLQKISLSNLESLKERIFLMKPCSQKTYVFGRPRPAANRIIDYWNK